MYEHELDGSKEPILGSQKSLKYVSRNPSGGRIGNGASGQPSITANGQRVAYSSLASNLIDGVTGPPDTNEQSDVFVHDLPMQSQHRISLGSPCCQYQLGGPSFQPAISGDGMRVMFTTLDPYVLYTVTDQDYLTHRRFDFSGDNCYTAVQRPFGGWPIHETDPDSTGAKPATPPADRRFPIDVVNKGCLPAVSPDASLDMHVFLIDLQGTGTLPSDTRPVSISDWKYRFSSLEQIDRRNIGTLPRETRANQEITYARHGFFQADFGNAFSVVPGPQALSYDGQTFIFDSAADNLQAPNAVQADADNQKLWGDFWEYGWGRGDLCQGCTSYASLPSYGYSCLAMAFPAYSGALYNGDCSFLLEDKNQAIDVYFFSRWHPYVYPVNDVPHMKAKKPPWAKP